NVGAVTLPPKGRAQVMRELDSEGRGAAFHYGHIRRLDRDDRRAQSVGDQVTSRDRRSTIGGRGITRFSPGHREIVATTAFFLQRLDVVPESVGQGDGGRFLRGISVPLPRIRPGGNGRDLDLVRRVFIRAQVQRGIIVAGNPEEVAARYRRNQERAHPLAVIVGKI